MKTCDVMVGFPATGKSTLVDKLFEENPEAFIFSTDNKIEELSRFNGMTYDEGFETFIGQATTYMENHLSVAIRSNQNIIWDQTNLGAKKRSKIINRMKQSGYHTVCRSIEMPHGFYEVQEWNRRLQSREGKTIPKFVIESMIKTYQRPLLEEGFDDIKYYDMYGEIIK